MQESQHSNVHSCSSPAQLHSTANTLADRRVQQTEGIQGEPGTLDESRVSNMGAEETITAVATHYDEAAGNSPAPALTTDP